MTNHLRSLLVVYGLCAAACTGDVTGDDPGATAPECQLDSKSEKSPGYPFDVQQFGTDVMPVLAKSCGTAGCHAAPTGQGSFTVWASAKPGDCDFAKTFNNVVAKVDLASPANSRLIAAVSGGSPTHPFNLQPTSGELATLRGFVEAASATYAADGGGQTPPPGPSPFNYAVYQSTIQPMLERCTGAACHSNGQGGFTLKATPAPNSADMEANFIAVTSRANLVTPANSVVYARATVVHGGGGSKTIDGTQSAALIAWIEDAKKNAGNNPNPTCAPIDKFNVGVFSSELLPILSGDLDLNSPDGQGRGAGCRSTACHGIDRGPGKLSLPATADAGTLLQNFACFTNLASPAASEILACPTNSPGCRSYPHPGQDVLGGANDFNFQKMLAYIYGANAVTSPLDFAFFARRVHPILNDPNAVEGGAQGRSCADSIACHGISVAGQAAPNGSDFAVISNASGFDRLTFNFVSATGFVNFLNPRGSSLFMYPTDEIANRGENPFATGIPHPGGLDFAPDSVEALTILQWAGGLRPDRNGFMRNWLVVGDFPATQIIDPTLIQETSVVPRIFDRGGGAFNRGEWDGLFSDVAEVDLNTAFPRNVNAGRAAYATTYVLNTVPRTLRVQLEIATDNPVRIYVDGALVAQNAASGGTSAFLTLNAAGANAKPVRIMLKILQRETDNRFAFTARLRDELGVVLNDVTREVVFTLGPNGGI
jgi:hypothetical protein